MKIKTLKDLDFRDCVCAGVVLDGNIDSILKEEAIKWVKELRLNPYNVLLREFGIMPLSNPGVNGVITQYMGVDIQLWAYFLEQFIKHNYNITEEDLK